MQPEAWLIAETRAWFLKVEEDLQAGDLCLRSGKSPLLAPAAFHAQQAAEKALKGFLTWHSTPFAKTHELLIVGEPCWRIDATLRAAIERVLPLSTYAWKHRYPGEPFVPTRGEALEAVQAAQALATAILERLPAEVRPY